MQIFMMARCSLVRVAGIGAVAKLVCAPGQAGAASQPVASQRPRSRYSRVDIGLGKELVRRLASGAKIDVGKPILLQPDGTVSSLSRQPADDRRRIHPGDHGPTIFNHSLCR